MLERRVNAGFAGDLNSGGEGIGCNGSGVMATAVTTAPAASTAAVSSLHDRFGLFDLLRLDGDNGGDDNCWHWQVQGSFLVNSVIRDWQQSQAARFGTTRAGALASAHCAGGAPITARLSTNVHCTLNEAIPYHTMYLPTRHDRKQDTPSRTAENTATDVSQPEACDEQTQPKRTLTEQPRARQLEHHLHHGGSRNDKKNAACTRHAAFLTPHDVFARSADLQSCRVATDAMIDDEPAKNRNKPQRATFRLKKTKHTTSPRRSRQQFAATEGHDSWRSCRKDQ